MSDTYSDRHWASLEEKLNSQFQLMEMGWKHIVDIKFYKQANLEIQVQSPSQKYAFSTEPNEPNNSLRKTRPFQHNRSFHGRQDDIDQTLNHLSHIADQSLHAYTIYDRHDASKTKINLQYANTNSANYGMVLPDTGESGLVVLLL